MGDLLRILGILSAECGLGAVGRVFFIAEKERGAENAESIIEPQRHRDTEISGWREGLLPALLAVRYNLVST